MERTPVSPSWPPHELSTEPMGPRPSSRHSLPVVGITGAVGTGKSQVAALFEEWGGILVSGDLVGKDVVDRSRRLRGELVRVFGDAIVRGDRLQRSLLAKRAFASVSAARMLNQIVHPALIKELNRRVRRAQRSRQHCAVVIDAALLAEWGPQRVHWDRLVGVWAPLEIRRKRMSKRGWSASQVSARARCQMSWTARRAMVDYVVKNDGSLSLLERRARLCWQKVLSSR